MPKAKKPRPVKTRKFDGKVFEYWNTYQSQSQADSVADAMKASDALARIIKTKEGYELYLREGRKRRHKEKYPDDGFIPDNWEEV